MCFGLKSQRCRGFIPAMKCTEKEHRLFEVGSGLPLSEFQPHTSFLRRSVIYHLNLQPCQCFDLPIGGRWVHFMWKILRPLKATNIPHDVTESSAWTELFAPNSGSLWRLGGPAWEVQRPKTEKMCFGRDAVLVAKGLLPRTRSRRVDAGRTKSELCDKGRMVRSRR